MAAIYIALRLKKIDKIILFRVVAHSRCIYIHVQSNIITLLYSNNNNNMYRSKLFTLQFLKKCLKNVNGFNLMVTYTKFHDP